MNAARATKKLASYKGDSNSARNFARYAPLPLAAWQLYNSRFIYMCSFLDCRGGLYSSEPSSPISKTKPEAMHNVSVPMTDDPGRDPPEKWYSADVPIFWPHEVLSYLFDDVGIQVPDIEIKKYWREAREAGIPWALESDGEENKLPVKIFGDDCQINDSGDKVFAFVISCPLWRPNNARNSRWPVAILSLRHCIGWATIRPLLAELVSSLNKAFDNPTCGGLTFQVTEIGMDWKAFRELLQLKSHWNASFMCHMCRINNSQYADLPEDLNWRNTAEFIAEVLRPNELTPIILLRRFSVSCLAWCSLHNVNLGLLWTINGGCLQYLLENNIYGNLLELGYGQCLKLAFRDFKTWQSNTKIRCSQREFTSRMLFKKGHGAYLSAKGHNSRCIAAFLSDKFKSLLDMGGADPPRELLLQTHCLCLELINYSSTCLNSDEIKINHETKTLQKQIPKSPTADPETLSQETIPHLQLRRSMDEYFWLTENAPRFMTHGCIIIALYPMSFRSLALPRSNSASI